jgi:ligand-binding sensor domain-containing protein/signal transduction histidine kinase/DNA-binding response OmpR family regulator
MVTKRIITSLVGFILCIHYIYVFAQDMRFHRFSINEGLSNTFVKDIVQDHKGFIWIATTYGLNRYDGYNFKSYLHDPEKPGTISDHDIEVLLEDSQKRLWAGTANGLSLYNRDLDRFESIRPDSTIISFDAADNHILSLYEGGDGEIWVGTKKGIKLLTEDETRLVRDEQLPGLPSDLIINAIAADQSGNIWLGTDNGLYRYNKHSSEIAYFGSESFSNLLVRSLHIDRFNNLWAGTYGGGMYLYNRRMENFIRVSCGDCDISGNLPDDKIRWITSDHKDKLWVGTEQGGVCMSHIQDYTYSRPIHFSFTCFIDDEKPFSLSYRTVTVVYEDRDHNLWFGTHSGGVNFVAGTKDKFKMFQREAFSRQTLSHRKIWGILEDSFGYLWVGTDGGGLNVLHKEKGVVQEFQHDPADRNSLSNDAIISAFKDSNGILWFGTYSGGLNEYDYKSKTFKHYQYSTTDSSSISDNDIRVIYEDKNRQLWIGTRSGLNIIDLATKRNRRILAFRNKDIRAIHQDARGRLWIGVFNEGLKHYIPETEEVVDYPLIINDRIIPAHQTINTIAEDDSGSLWLGTYSGGLVKFTPDINLLMAYTENDGLANNRVNKILIDKQKNLWLSTDFGISRFYPETGSFVNYGKSDGIHGLEFHAGSGFISESGHMYFGSIDGIVYFHPDSIGVNPLLPTLVFSDFRIFNRPVSIGTHKSPLRRHISVTNEIVLNHKQSIFSIEYAGIDFSINKENNYAYILEGLESEWNYVGVQRTATYTNLQPGEYLFLVKASNSDGLWTPEPLMLKINILPPPWKTWWAYLIYLIFIAAMMYGLRYLTLKQMKLRNRLALAQLENQKEHELHQMKIQFFTQISHEFRTPLTLILAPLEDLMRQPEENASYFRKKIPGILKNAKQLLRLVDQLMHFRKLESGKLKLKTGHYNLVEYTRQLLQSFEEYANKRNIQLQFASVHPELYVWYDPGKMEIILNNLIFNAFKFTPEGGNISLMISKKNALETAAIFSVHKTSTHLFSENWVQINVSDSGYGIKQEDIDQIFESFYQAKNDEAKGGTGLGLTLVKGLTELHKGKVFASSEYGHGSTFSLYFPMGDKHLDASEKDNNPDVNSLFTQENKIDAFENLVTGSGLIQEDEIPEGLQMLIVEDNPEVGALIADIFKSEFKIHLAGSGMEGLEMASSIIPDIIITDVYMPGMNGVDLCKALKDSENTSHIPVIILTARATEEGLIEGLHSGANDYLTKPFHPEVLRSKVQNLMELRDKMREKNKRVISLEPGEIEIEAADEKFLRKIIEIIENNLTNTQFGVKYLVSEMKMSRSVFYRKLQALTGKSVNEFIISIRLKRAAQLLQSGEYTVNQAAWEAGYNDIKHFRMQFKEAFGITPSAFINYDAKH